MVNRINLEKLHEEIGAAIAKELNDAGFVADPLNPGIFRHKSRITVSVHSMGPGWFYIVGPSNPKIFSAQHVLNVTEAKSIASWLAALIENANERRRTT